MARSTLKASSATKGEHGPSPALVETLANLDFILIIGGALPRQLSVSLPGNDPQSILAQLATKTGLPSTSSSNFFSVLEWALEKMGRPGTVKVLERIYGYEDEMGGSTSTGWAPFHSSTHNINDLV